MLLKPLILLVAFASSSVVYAQGASYAGQQSREIKALSEQERSDLLSGAGAGYAKAADLNGYPGPAHVVELGQQLHLSPQQLEASKLLLARHKAQARRLGAALIEAERVLDREFASGRAEREAVSRATAQIGSLQTELRLEHLRTHLAQADLLTPQQVAQYNELRGYGGGGESSSGGHKH